LAAWQNGAFKCAPRDRWVGWRSAQQFRRLERVANKTRFLILSAPGVFPNLASRFLSLMTRRLSADWLAAHGHCVLLAETFCDPALFPGTMYRAASWEGLGETKGYARANGRYTDPHGRPKEIFVTPLLSDPRPRGAPRRAQGRKHTVASVLTVHGLAEIGNMTGCLAAAQFARALSREELEAVGAWRNPRTWSAAGPGPGFPSPGRAPPTASASGAPTATATAITRPWPSSTTRPARPARS